MNTDYRKSLPGSDLDYFDTREAIEALSPGAYDGLPYTSKVLAENLVRRCSPDTLKESLQQIIERKRELDFPWFPARVRRRCRRLRRRFRRSSTAATGLRA